MTNVDKAESIASPKISSSIPLISMWVLLEGKPSSVKINVNPSNFASQRPDLNDLKPILSQKFNILKDVEPEDIEFFADKDRTQSLLSDVALATLNTTASSPLIVRYPLSTSSIFVKFRFLRRGEEYRMSHSSGSWNLLRKITKTKYDKLAEGDFYFIVQNNSEEEIGNEYQFNNLVMRTKPNDQDERILNLKVQIKGKKAYGDWSLKEVSKDIYNNAFDSIYTMKKFKVEELPELSPPLSEEELKRFVENLLDKMSVFHNEVSTNEATAREFISIFLTLAVSHVRKYNDQTTRLNVEFELDGSRGYGFLDYAVIIQQILILVTEAKWSKTEQAVAQNLVQIYSAVEKLLGKRKLEQTDFEPSLPPPVMFGIVTTGRGWRFVRWSGTLESPSAEITEEYGCEFNNDDNDMKSAKKVVDYIARILQAQAQSIALQNNKNQDKKSDAKRLCTGVNF